MMVNTLSSEIYWGKTDRYPAPVYVYGFSTLNGPCDHISSEERQRTDGLNTGRMRRQAHRLTGMARETAFAECPF